MDNPENTHPTPNRRNLSLDILRVGFGFLIIFLHCYGAKQDLNLFQNFFVQGFLQTCRAVFLIISGYYFETSLKNHGLRGWSKHVLKFYLVWMLVYSPFWIQEQGWNPFNLIFGYYHIWYIPALLLAGLMLAWIRKLNPETGLVIALTAFFLGILGQKMLNFELFGLDYQPGDPNTFNYHRNFLFTAFPMLFLGHYIRKKDLVEKTSTRNAVLLLAAGLLLLFVESSHTYLFAKTKNTDNLVGAILAVPAYFLLAMKAKIKSDNPFLNSKEFAATGIAIYFTHPLGMKGAAVFHTYGSWQYTLTTIGLTALAVTWVVVLNRKTKGMFL